MRFIGREKGIARRIKNAAKITQLCADNLYLGLKGNRDEITAKNLRKNA
jgi:hypothetical protein